MYEAIQKNEGWESYVLPMVAKGDISDRRTYLNFAYVPGKDLIDYMNLMRPNAAIRKQILLDIARALKFCVENAKVTHGDVRPDNIYVVDLPGGGVQARLFDFGYGELAGPREDVKQSLIKNDIILFVDEIAKVIYPGIFSKEDYPGSWDDVIDRIEAVQAGGRRHRRRCRQATRRTGRRAARRTRRS